MGRSLEQARVLDALATAVARAVGGSTGAVAIVDAPISLGCLPTADAENPVDPVRGHALCAASPGELTLGDDGRSALRRALLGRIVTFVGAPDARESADVVVTPVAVDVGTRRAEVGLLLDDRQPTRAVRVELHRIDGRWVAGPAYGPR